jgi:hypothetical protein
MHVNDFTQRLSDERRCAAFKLHEKGGMTFDGAFGIAASCPIKQLRAMVRGQPAKPTVPRDDPQRQRCYDWERAFRPVEPQPVGIPVRHPFKPEFLQFFATAWEYGCGLHGNSRAKKWPQYIAADNPPRLRFSIRLRSARGHAGFSFGRAGIWRPTLTIGGNGMTRGVLLHEMAHVLTTGDGHGPDFCRVALDLYVKFLGVDEGVALRLADEHGVRIA